MNIRHGEIVAWYHFRSAFKSLFGWELRPAEHYRGSFNAGHTWPRWGKDRWPPAKVAAMVDAANWALRAVRRVVKP
mgnify:CR=1 FL=1